MIARKKGYRVIRRGSNRRGWLRLESRSRMANAAARTSLGPGTLTVRGDGAAYSVQLSTHTHTHTHTHATLNAHNNVLNTTLQVG
jgi:hypothetical protein